MKKVSITDNCSLLPESAKKNLAEIERLLNQSHQNLKEAEDDLIAIKNTFALTPPSLPPHRKIIH